MVRSLTSSAIRYTLWQLSSRCGITGGTRSPKAFEVLPVSVHYDRPERVRDTSAAIIVVPCADDAWEALLNSRLDSLDWIQQHSATPTGAAFASTDAVPVLFWGAGCEGGRSTFAKRQSDGSVVFYADIIAATLFMLSRWEETVVPDRDEHGRFPATASVAYKQGFLDRPIVDEYALILREWLKVLLPRWEPERRPFSLQLSHDVDHVRRFPSLISAVRCAGGDLLKRQSITEASRSIRDAALQVVSPSSTSYVAGIRQLANLSREYGFSNDVFYFMGDGPGPYGGGYDPSKPLVRQAIRALQNSGFDIGLHASYDTLDDPERLEREKRHLEAVVGAPVRSVRQHYLRFQATKTWRHFEQAGLEHDSTMGYPDHEGFRCGTCHPFRPFDLEQDRELDVVELPLVVMDGTLRQHRGLTPTRAAHRVLELADRCAQVEGTFTLLWHNSSLTGEWIPWAHMYRKIVGELAQRATS